MTPVSLAGVAARAATARHTTTTRTVRCCAVLGASVGLPAPAALDPDPDQARRWVEEELAKDDYRDRRSLLQQLLDWLRRRLADLQNPTSRGDLSLPPFVIAGVAVLVVVVLVVLATRVRRERRVVAATSTVLGDSLLTAAQLRARAAAAVREGRYDDAVLDIVRAIAREADARTLLTDAPALTAHEIGRQLAMVFPDHVAAVTRATDRFDAVAYGRLSATREHADDVVATDESLRRARPVLPHRPRGGGAASAPSGDAGPASGGHGDPSDPGHQPGASAPFPSGDTPQPPGPPVAPGELVGSGLSSWSTTGRRPGRRPGRRGGGSTGTGSPDDDHGSVWTTGGGS